MNRSNRTLVDFARRHRLPALLVTAIARSRCQKLLRRMRPWLPQGSSILDVGTGSAHMAEAVQAAGHQVFGCDVTDMRFVPMPFIRADGAQLPFAKDTFDGSLLITVLHHVPQESHAAMLREATRVLRAGGRLLILEDTYRNHFERMMTMFFDSVSNVEIFGHPHSNRNLAGWLKLIDQTGLRAIEATEFSLWYGPFRIRHALIVIEKVRGVSQDRGISQVGKGTLSPPQRNSSACEAGVIIKPGA